MDPTFSHDVSMDGIKSGGNFIAAVFAGLLAAFVSTLLWAVIASETGPESDYLCLLVAILVGLSVRSAGNGPGIRFGMVGVVMTLLGSFAGTVLAVLESATTDRLDLFGVVSHLDIVAVMSSIVTQATPMTYIFLGVSLIIAFQTSIRQPEYR